MRRDLHQRTKRVLLCFFPRKFLWLQGHCCGHCHCNNRDKRQLWHFAWLFSSISVYMGVGRSLVLLCFRFLNGFIFLKIHEVDFWYWVLSFSQPQPQWMQPTNGSGQDIWSFWPCAIFLDEEHRANLRGLKFLRRLFLNRFFFKSIIIDFEEKEAHI